MRFADGKITAEVVDGVGLVTFNAADSDNAVSAEMWKGLGEALDTLDEDPGVRVLVLTGAGHVAFASGAETGRFDDEPGGRQEYEKQAGAGRERLARVSKPIIARVRGRCHGGGLGIALAADLRIAAADSSFCLPGARHGAAYSLAVTRQLVGLIGPANARMLLYTGAAVEGAEAARMGLVNEVVADEALNDRVADLARTVADSAPLSVRAAKLAVSAATAEPGQADERGVEEAVAACFRSEDRAEGRAAAKEKRAPRFKGR